MIISTKIEIYDNCCECEYVRTDSVDFAEMFTCGVDPSLDVTDLIIQRSKFYHPCCPMQRIFIKGGLV